MHAAHVQWITEHMRLAAVLQTLQQLAAQAIARPRDADLRAARAMLVYLADYPQRVHHRREESELFPRLRGRVAGIDLLLDRLAGEHAASAAAVLRLMHALNRAEFGGAAEREGYAAQVARFVADWHAHIQAEERELFPAAERLLAEADWQAIAGELARERDPLHGLPADAPFDDLLKLIVRIAPV
jgi:hemerythrin-like domain-containing protein